MLLKDNDSRKKSQIKQAVKTYNVALEDLTGAEKVSTYR